MIVIPADLEIVPGARMTPEAVIVFQMMAERLTQLSKQVEDLQQRISDLEGAS